MKQQYSNVEDLSGIFVGFWKFEVIRIAVKTGLIDILPGGIDTICTKIPFCKNKLYRFLRALQEIDLVMLHRGEWKLTDKGMLFSKDSKISMASCIKMWIEVKKQWDQYLEQLLLSEKEEYRTTFKDRTLEEKDIAIYQDAIDGYALVDFKEIIPFIPWGKQQKVMGIGRVAVTFIKLLLEYNKNIQGCVYNTDVAMNNFIIPENLLGRLKKQFIVLDEIWPAEKFDTIVMPRYLQDFPDDMVAMLLNKVRRLLAEHGRVYIFEMFLDKDNPRGSLLDINMLAESGGRLRTLGEWEFLLAAANLKIITSDSFKPHLGFIEVGINE